MSTGIVGHWLLPEIVWFVAVVILSISILITTLFAFVRRSRTGTADIVDTIHVECASCRWVGEVPRLRKRCPMCGANNFTT